MNASTIEGRPRRVDRRRDSLFFTATAVVMALVVFVGFSRSFFLPFWMDPDPLASSDSIYIAHGVASTVWIVVLIVQPFLIRSGRIRQHRKIGWVGAGIASLVVLLGVWASLDSAARPADHPLPALPPDLLGMLFANLAIFGSLVALAIVWRRDRLSHERLMMLATLNMLQAPIVRIPLAFITELGSWPSFLLAYSFVLPLAGWDLITLGRLHKVTLWVGGALVLTLPVRYWISATPQWRAVADWVVGLVG